LQFFVPPGGSFSNCKSAGSETDCFTLSHTCQSFCLISNTKLSQHISVFFHSSCRRFIQGRIMQLLFTFEKRSHVSFISYLHINTAW
jgi:hypothetical protein